MVKKLLIASIIIGTAFAFVSLSYFLAEPFPPAAWIICAVVGAFALIAVEQN